MPQKTFVISWVQYPYSIFNNVTSRDIENALEDYYRNRNGHFKVAEIPEKDSIKDSDSASDDNDAD